MNISVKRANLLFITCLILKALIVMAVFAFKVYSPTEGYEISETLLNYKQGFQRRSLIGSGLLFITENKSLLLLLIKGVYLLCVAVLFFLMLKPLRKYNRQLMAVLFLLFLCSPFGFSFYKTLWYKKELFFIPLIAVSMFAFTLRSNGLKFLILNSILFTGYLIHESFLFLVLPFLLCCCFLKNIKTIYTASLIVTGLIAIWVVRHFSVPAEPSISHYVAYAQQIGLDTSNHFMIPLQYMRMDMHDTLQITLKHLAKPYIFIYLFLYLLNTWFFVQLYLFYRENIIIANKKKLLNSLIFIHACIIPLFIIGIDYGRWFSFTFIISLFLLFTEMEIIGMDFIPAARPLRYKIVLALFALFFLCIKIPLFVEFDTGHFMNYSRSFLSFLKNP